MNNSYPDNYYEPLTEKVRPSQEQLDLALARMLENGAKVNYVFTHTIDITDDGVALKSVRHPFSFWWWLRNLFKRPKFSKEALEIYDR